MAGLDDTSRAATETGERPQPLEPDVDYRIDRQGLEGTEPADHTLESSGYESRGFKGQELREFREQHDGEFTEVLSRSYPVEKFGDPDGVVRNTNPFYGDGSRSFDVNCADCARSVERTWRGEHEEAAGRVPQLDATGAVIPHGEQSSLTEEWAGENFSSAPNDAELRQALIDGGHGSSAIVHSTWERIDQQQSAGGHAYNLVNYHGDIRVLDGQTGENLGWVRGDIHPGIGQDSEHKAIAWNARGERIW